MTNEPALPPDSGGGDHARRTLLLAVAIGFVVPMLAFLMLPETEAPNSWWLGSTVWSVVAFVGVALLFFERTRRVGLGMLLGFGCLLVVGAGACTVILIAGG
jgi:hypothetical protein